MTDEELKKAAEEYAFYNFASPDYNAQVDWIGYCEKVFLAGAKWMEAHTPLPEDSVLFNKGVEEGKRLMREEAEPAEIGYFNHRGLSILTEKSIERMPVSEGDKVRVIILKED